MNKDGDAIEEFSLLDDVDLDSGFNDPVEIEPLVVQTSRPAQPAGALAKAFAATGALKNCEAILPPHLSRGVLNRMMIESAVAAVLSEGDSVSVIELLEALYHAREKTTPGVSRALQSHQILLRPLPVLAGQDVTALTLLGGLVERHLEMDVPPALLGPDPVAGLSAVEEILEHCAGHRVSAGGRVYDLPRTIAAAIEAQALIVALDLKRPLLPPIERHLDLSRPYVEIIGARAGQAIGHYKHLFVKWQDRPPLTRTGTTTVLRRVADLALEQPAVSVSSAMQLLGISKPAATKVLDHLEKDGFLQELTGQRGWRIWRA